MLNNLANDTALSYEPFLGLEEKKFWLLQDRRTNPHVKSRRRKGFDRRSSLRVGTNAAAFINTTGKRVSGTVKNISDSGICIKVSDMEAENTYIFPDGSQTYC